MRRDWRKRLQAADSTVMGLTEDTRERRNWRKRIQAADPTVMGLTEDTRERRDWRKMIQVADPKGFKQLTPHCNGTNG